MLDEQTLQKMRDMKMNAMAEAFDELQQEAPSNQRSFAEKVGHMIDREWMSRENRRLTRLIRAARLNHDATLEDVWTTQGRGVTKTVVRDLSACRWVTNNNNVLLSGAHLQPVGLTHKTSDTPLAEHVVAAEDLVDVVQDIRAEGLGPLDPVTALTHPVFATLGREMLGPDAPAAWRLSLVRGNARVFPVQLDRLGGDPSEQRLADESPGCGVPGLLDEDATVAMHRRLSPRNRLPCLRWQGEQDVALRGFEGLDGLAVGRAVDAASRDLEDPVFEHPVEHLHVALVADRLHEVALDVANSRFDLALLLRAVRRRGVNLEPEVPGQLAIAPIENRLGSDVERRSQHRGLEVVGHHGLGHAAEPIERRDVQRKPRLDLLVEDDARELVSRVPQHHQEHVRLAQPLLLRVPQLPDRAEVDLRDQLRAASPPES